MSYCRTRHVTPFGLPCSIHNALFVIATLFNHSDVHHWFMVIESHVSGCMRTIPTGSHLHRLASAPRRDSFILLAFLVRSKRQLSSTRPEFRLREHEKVWSRFISGGRRKFANPGCFAQQASQLVTNAYSFWAVGGLRSIAVKREAVI